MVKSLKTLKNFIHLFYSLVIDSKEKFIVLEDEDGAKVVINKEDALAAEEELLKRYSIKANKSDDL